jgi:AmpE protein
MIFLSLIAVFGLLIWLGNPTWIQQDRWFHVLAAKLQRIPGIAAVSALPLILALLIPLVVLLILFILISQTAGKLYLFVLYVPVLLYSLGRGDLISDVKQYLEYVRKGDNVAAALWLENFRGKPLRGYDNLHEGNIEDWKTLHTKTLKAVAYRSFERNFAVIFWFVIIGPFGALLYRLSVLYHLASEAGSDHAKVAGKWLWILEFPSVRLMGVTWALVGNFDTSPLRHTLTDLESSSARILNECLRGALGAPTQSFEAQHAEAEAVERENSEQEREKESEDLIEDLTGEVITTHSEPAYSLALIRSALTLHSRSLLFWICAIAFATLFI